MPWTMPSIPDQLKTLLMRRQSPVAPAGAQPPSPYGPQPTPQTVAQNRMEEAGGQPAAPAAMEPGGQAAVQSVPRTMREPVSAAVAPQAPPPTDDPTVAPLDTSKTPDVMSYLNPRLQKMNELLARHEAVPAVNPASYKPNWKDRLLGAGVGFLASYGDNSGRGARAGAEVTWRKLRQAQAQREAALEPIDEQIKAEREAFPLYTAVGQALHNQAELGLATHRENRESYTAKQNAGYKSDWNDIRNQRVQDQQQYNQDRIANAQDRLNETADRNRQIAEIRDRVATAREQALKDKESSGGKRGTPGQFAGAEVKKNQAIQKAHAAFAKVTSELDPKDGKESTRRAFQQAHDDYEQAAQDAQNAYEQEIVSLGGTAQHSDTSQWQGSSRGNNASPNQETVEKVNELGGRKVGDVGVVRGQRVKITAIYKNGKFDYEPLTGAQ